MDAGGGNAASACGPADVLLQHLTSLGLWSGVEPSRSCGGCAAPGAFRTSMTPVAVVPAVSSSRAGLPRGLIPATASSEREPIDPPGCRYSQRHSTARPAPRRAPLRYKGSAKRHRRLHRLNIGTYGDRSVHGESGARQPASAIVEEVVVARLKRGKCFFLRRAADWSSCAALR